MTYPRIATCRVTGVKTIVETPEEERRFHRQILVPMAIAFVVILGCCAAMGYLVVTSWLAP